MDLFKKYLKLTKSVPILKRAITCKSYRNVYYFENGVILKDEEINHELATFGDAVLKFVLCEKFLDKKDKLSKYIQKYLTDKNLIEIIGKHYQIIDYLYFDYFDISVPRDYVFDRQDRHKYIATSVEAMLGAIYLYKKNLNDVRKIIDEFIKLVDSRVFK